MTGPLDSPEPESVTRAILAAIRAEGYAVPTINYLIVDGPAVKYTARVNTGSEVRPPNVEVWTAKAPTRYQAAVALAEALGWELDA